MACIEWGCIDQLKNMDSTQDKYILYACAGCSKGGQAAYQTAIELDARKVAEMSCLAGIASGKPSFFRKIKNRKVVAIDGCPIECAKAVLQKQGLEIAEHFQLKDYGIRKNETASEEHIKSVIEQISDKLTLQDKANKLTHTSATVPGLPLPL